MQEYSIFILDTDETRIDFFETRFKRDEQDVKTVTKIADIFKTEQKPENAAFLAEYNTLTAENRPDVIKFFKNYSSQYIFIFNVPANANKRLAFYELGAKCVFDSSQPLDEIYYAITWPLKNLKESQSRSLLISSGKLDDTSLISIIKNIAQEERSGILKIITFNNSGKIYFREGFITHAQVGLHQGEEAALHMLFWHSGNYTFNTTTVFDDRDTIRLSLVGLLIIAEKLRKEYLAHLQEIGSQETVVQLKYKDDLTHSSLEVNTGFLGILERPVVLSSALENSFYTCYQTAEKLSLLKKHGFLSVNDPVARQENRHSEAEILPISSSALFGSQEEKQIRLQLNADGSSAAKIALFSGNMEESDSFMRKLMKNNTDIIHTEEHSLIRLLLDSDFNINIYGLEVDEDILKKIDEISDGLSAMIFLINCQKADEFEYKAYVLRYCSMLYKVPWILGIYNTGDGVSEEDIRTIFHIPEYMPVVHFDPQEDAYIKEIFLKLKKYEPVENEKSVQNNEKG